ncbi:MAG: hypothetical protein KDI19_06300 [Pseudomonadales bacterium]|nr:hypothetical protein [Pseudomonadales bacterium]
MPVTYKIDDSGIVVATLTGKITEQDIVHSFEYLQTSRDIPRPLRLLNDAREMDSYPVDYIEGSAYVQQMLDALAQRGESVKIGYLVSRDLIFGILRRVQTLLDLGGIEIGVFRELDEILDWFNLPLDSTILASGSSG